MTSGTGTALQPERRGSRCAGRPARQVRRCACGKRCFPSARAAEQVVFEARIARAVRKNRRRREDRHYRCRYGEWHTTSQDRRSATAA